ncbi:hypothetical protein AVEN_219465-1 [Araneus ventricosus]|uniref:Uncharacterized protein n=1 Tax=Araneus ventricosus TaxID=182803 RepID=A0A4Y2BMZ8_ARAVE|nr:hypothetical protein AVEN_219465-1 [Araneus ventricosus]
MSCHRWRCITDGVVAQPEYMHTEYISQRRRIKGHSAIHQRLRSPTKRTSHFDTRAAVPNGTMEGRRHVCCIRCRSSEEQISLIRVP